jgi:predicted deacylase
MERPEIAGFRVDLPLFLVNGAETGPCLVVTAGIHGAEYASIEAALQLGRSLNANDLKGQVIVVPVVNVPGFRARSMYVCPLDGQNVNRVFPGDREGTASAQLADWLVREVIRQADYYVDLHDGDLTEAIVPFAVCHPSGDGSLDAQMHEMALVVGLPHVVCRHVSGTATNHAASKLGIPSVVIEGGGQGMWAPEAVAVHTRGLNRLMRHWDMLAGPKPEPIPAQVLEQFVWLQSEQAGYFYPQVTVGEHVRSGQMLGSVTDFEGRVLLSAVAPIDGQVLVVQSSLAMNVGEFLLAIGA